MHTGSYVRARAVRQQGHFITGGFTFVLRLGEREHLRYYTGLALPYMGEASLLLKIYGACLCYQVYPQNYIFHNEERKAGSPGSRHVALERICFGGRFKGPRFIKHHKKMNQSVN